MASSHGGVRRSFFALVTRKWQADGASGLLFFNWIKKRPKALQTLYFSLILALRKKAADVFPDLVTGTASHGK